MALSIEQINKLEQENERLKANQRSFENCDKFAEYGKEIAKYQTVLQEIKEIAEENLNCEGENHPCPQSQDILKKITEVM